MSENCTFKVLGTGSPILDVILRCDEELVKGLPGGKGGMALVEDSFIKDILARGSSQPSFSPGGSAANTIFGLSRLGVPTALLGKTGKDKESEIYRGHYMGMGGDLSHLKASDTLPTGKCLCMVTPDSERTMRTCLGAAADLSPEDFASEDWSDISHVHAEGYLLYNEALTNKIFEMARNHYCTTSFDLASFEVVRQAGIKLHEILEKHVDIVFANEEEARAFAGTDNIMIALDKLSDLCDVAVVKLGKAGAFIMANGKRSHAPAEPVENPVDTTGAGDLWAAGFLYGYLNGHPADKSGRYGAVLGAEAVKTLGAAIPDARWPEIRRRIEEIRNGQAIHPVS